jgi:hypothetical protein
MWRPLSKLLEAIGSLGPRARPGREVFIGPRDATDEAGGDSWRRYVRPEELHDLWGPARGSLWEPFHAAPLFAALDRLSPTVIGPVAPPRLEAPIGPEAPPPPWAGAGTLVMADLDGPRSVSVAVWLCAAAGYQPVCTFDNWPDRIGLVKSEAVLGALLYHAPRMAAARAGLRADSPPVWICDRDRLSGSIPARASYFDNRYLLDDSLLPGPGLLRSAGLRRLVYLAPPGLTVREDLGPYLTALERSGVDLFELELGAPEGLAALRTLVPSTAPLPLGITRRSAAGGFGAIVRPPSEWEGGGGGSFRGGYG